jgi:hypothetical protein
MCACDCSVFPENRPDLPVAYYAKYIFSDSYIRAVTPEMALRIHTAVTNPITVMGRVRLAQGALLHRDLRADVRCAGRAPDARAAAAARF